MTSELPPQVAPRTPREPQPPGRPPTPPSRRQAPPREFMAARRDFTMAFHELRKAWNVEAAGEKELEAFRALSETAAQLAQGDVTGQEVLDRLA